MKNIDNMSIISHIQSNATIRFDPCEQDTWVIELWSQAHPSEKGNDSFLYRFNANPGFEVPDDKVEFEFYSKYLMFLNFKIQLVNLPAWLYFEAIKNFAVLFLLKGYIIEAFWIITTDLSKHVTNPFLEVFQHFVERGGIYYRRTYTEHRIEFIRQFARMFNAGDDTVDTIMSVLDSVDINETTVGEVFSELIYEMRHLEEMEEMQCLVEMSEWLADTFW